MSTNTSLNLTAAEGSHKFYRFSDPRRGFRLYQQFQLESRHRNAFLNTIEQINQDYRECADRQTQCFLNQPTQSLLLFQCFWALALPILIVLILNDFTYIFQQYLISLVFIGWSLYKWIQRSDRCRQQFEEANEKLKEKFYRIQEEFQVMHPGFSINLSREWNELDQICNEYIEIRCNSSNMKSVNICREIIHEEDSQQSQKQQEINREVMIKEQRGGVQQRV